MESKTSTILRTVKSETKRRLGEEGAVGYAEDSNAYIDRVSGVRAQKRSREFWEEDTLLGWGGVSLFALNFEFFAQPPRGAEV